MVDGRFMNRPYGLGAVGRCGHRPLQYGWDGLPRACGPRNDVGRGSGCPGDTLIKFPSSLPRLPPPSFVRLFHFNCISYARAALAVD